MALQYMTQEGLDKLKKELADAIAQRPVISAQIAEARDKGDLSENAEYEAAREAQGLLELNIAKLQDLVAHRSSAAHISRHHLRRLRPRCAVIRGFRHHGMPAGDDMTFLIEQHKRAVLQHVKSRIGAIRIPSKSIR